MPSAGTAFSSMSGPRRVSASVTQQIAEAIAQVSEQAIRDTDYCQGNVRSLLRLNWRRCCLWKSRFVRE